jgi:hypothetical protein
MDILYIIVAVFFFVVSAAFVCGCEKLEEAE